MKFLYTPPNTVRNVEVWNSSNYIEMNGLKWTLAPDEDASANHNRRRETSFMAPVTKTLFWL